MQCMHCWHSIMRLSQGGCLLCTLLEVDRHLTVLAYTSNRWLLGLRTGSLRTAGDMH